MQSSSQSAYVASALSFDRHMGDDSVIECVRSADKVKAFSSYTTRESGKFDSVRHGIVRNIFDYFLFLGWSTDTQWTNVYYLLNDNKQVLFFCKLISDLLRILNNLYYSFKCSTLDPHFTTYFRIKVIDFLSLVTYQTINQMLNFFANFSPFPTISNSNFHTLPF